MTTKLMVFGWNDIKSNGGAEFSTLGGIGAGGGAIGGKSEDNLGDVLFAVSVHDEVLHHGSVAFSKSAGNLLGVDGSPIVRPLFSITPLVEVLSAKVFLSFVD